MITDDALQDKDGFDGLACDFNPDNPDILIFDSKFFRQ